MWDVLWIVFAFVVGFYVGAVGMAHRLRRRFRYQDDPNWFWQGGVDVEWKPYSE